MEKRIRDAYKAEGFPCNPRPFLKALDEHVAEDTGAITDNTSKAVLLVLIQQAWGQMARVDTVDEYKRIEDSLARQDCGAPPRGHSITGGPVC